MSSAEIDIPRVTRTLLVHQGKPKTELAESLRISPSVLSKKLGGRRDWSAMEIMRMAEFFDVPVEVFFGDPHNLIRTVGTARNQDDPSGSHISNGNTQRECGDNSLDEALFQLAA